MKIAVIGSGAIGGLVAGYLKNAGQEVILAGHQDSIEAISQGGLNISGVRGNFNLKIQIRDRLKEKAGLVILAVKTQDIEKAVEDNLEYLKGAAVLTTQNGIRADRRLAGYLAQENIISSIVMFGATYLTPGNIVHNFEGKWVLGRPFITNPLASARGGSLLNGSCLGSEVYKNQKGASDFSPGGSTDSRLKEIAGSLGKAFSTVVTDDITGMKWLKIFVNANNCLAAILGKSMQEAFSNLEVCKISIRIWQEGLRIVRQAGIKLVSLPDFPLERLLKLSAMPLEEAAGIFSGVMVNLSRKPLYGSILQSIKRKRLSEIDFINGEFAALAKENKVSAVLNERLVSLVHNVEQSGRFLSLGELLESAGTKDEVF